jgi:metal-responsive CopG/Arc/MetJ family transcriptional regulator
MGHRPLRSTAFEPRFSFRPSIRSLSVNSEYNDLVKVKTSITLPEELLERLDRLEQNRSALLERAARAYLARLESEERDRRDVEIINRNAKRLNREALDTLEYQKLP